MKPSSNKYDLPFLSQSIRNKDNRNYKQKWKMGNKPLASNEPFLFPIQSETTRFWKILLDVYTCFKIPLVLILICRIYRVRQYGSYWTTESLYYFFFLFIYMRFTEIPLKWQYHELSVTTFLGFEIQQCPYSLSKKMSYS